VGTTVTVPRSQQPGYEAIQLHHMPSWHGAQLRRETTTPVPCMLGLWELKYGKSTFRSYENANVYSRHNNATFSLLTWHTIRML